MPSLPEPEPAAAPPPEPAVPDAAGNAPAKGRGKRSKQAGSCAGQAASALTDAQRAQQAAEAEAEMLALLAEEERLAAVRAQQAQRKVRFAGAGRVCGLDG